MQVSAEHFNILTGNMAIVLSLRGSTLSFHPYQRWRFFLNDLELVSDRSRLALYLLYVEVNTFYESKRKSSD